MKKTTTVFFLFFSCISYSQKDTLRPGNGLTISPPQISKEDFLIHWRLPNGTVRLISLISRSIESIPLNGSNTWAFIQQSRKDKSIDSDTTFFDPVTLRPLSYKTHIQSEGYKETVSFNKGDINVRVQYEDSSTTKTYTVPNGYIQATLTEYLISKLPLNAGYSTLFNIVNAGVNFASMTTSITVVEKEDLILNNAVTIPCWKVEVTNGNSKSTQWYTIKGQHMVKLVFGTKERGLFIKTRVL